MRFLVCALALSLGVAYADVPYDQTIDGGIIHGGTYFGTTTFINTAGGGIILPKGDNIHALSYNPDGGNVIINAPDQVVKLDGNIDLRGVFSDYKGAIPPNAGNLTVNAAYLFQNGNIYASGFKAGNIAMNVGGMTMGSGSLIDARSLSVGGPQPGGVVNITSTGEVEIQKGARIDVSGSAGSMSNGYWIGGFSNIVITGPVVNMDGVLQANQTFLPDNRPMMAVGNGSIKLIATNGDVKIGPDAVVQANDNNGPANQWPLPLFSGESIVVNASNDIKQNGLLQANGASGGAYSTGAQGQTIQFSPTGGGTISLSAGHDINQSGRLVPDGGNASNNYSKGFPGGNGGTITLKASDVIENNGVIRAMGGNTNPALLPVYSSQPNNGGNGGNVTFTGANPTGTGIVVTLAGFGAANGALGTITAPDPAASTNTMIGVWKKSP